MLLEMKGHDDSGLFYSLPKNLRGKKSRIFVQNLVQRIQDYRELKNDLFAIFRTY